MNFSHKYLYGLELNVEHKSMHLIMCIFLADWEYRYKPRSEYINQAKAKSWV